MPRETRLYRTPSAPRPSGTQEEEECANFLGTLDCAALDLAAALANVELDAKSYGWSRLATRTLASQVRLKYARKVAP
jgi:hypothetical protein